MFHVKHVPCENIILMAKEIPEHIRVGKLGETAALNHLKRKGFAPIESNFSAKTGEIDLIVRRDGRIHFIEVKTVSHGTLSRSKNDVSYGTYRPEDNVHRDKLRKVFNTIQVWLSKNHYEGEWQLDVAAVRIDKGSGKGSIRIIENVILE